MKLRALFLCAAASAATLVAADLVEGIVARVNDRLITQSEYDKRLLATRQGRAADAQARIVVLEDMIKEKLLEDRAKEMSVTATDEEIDAAVARVKGQYNLSTDAEFEAALAQTGLTKDELRRQMRENITLQKVIGREVAARMDLSDDALRLEYERQKEKLYATPETAKVSEIVLKFSASDPAERQQAAERAEELRQRIAKGAPFADLAKEFSQGTTKDRGGDLGVVAKGELVEALDAGIFVTPAAEYPPPVVTADAIHLFRVTDRKAAGYKPFSEVKEDLKKRISDDLYEKRFTEYMEHLRREAYVKIYDAIWRRSTRSKRGRARGPSLTRVAPPLRSPFPPHFSFDAVVRSHGWYDLPPFSYDRAAGRWRPASPAGPSSFRGRGARLSGPRETALPAARLRAAAAAHLLPRRRALRLRRGARRRPSLRRASRRAAAACSAAPASSRTPSRCC